MGYQHSCYFTDDDENRAVQEIATDRQWSVSQTIAYLVRKSPDFRKALSEIKSKSRRPRRKGNAA